jgi:uncharacterized lipoprotein YddW (UPF0748 family)
LRSVFFVPGLLALVLGVGPAVADTLIIDDFEYGSDAEAQAAWLNRGGSPRVTMADSGEWGDEGVMKLPCDFSTAQRDRCYWDRLDTFDLSAYSMFALEFWVPDPEAVGNFTLYFHSGSGWYKQSLNVTRPGWQTLTVAVTDFEIEGTPAGWDQVDTIRLSPWRESAVDTEFAVRELRAYTPMVFIFHDAGAENSALADRSADLIDFFLSRYDVSRGVLDGAAVVDGLLAGSEIVVLPYNDAITDTQMTAIEQFVVSGGKLMVYYLLPDRIATLLGFQRTGSAYVDLAAFEFDDPVIGHLPERVRQNSWTLTIAEPRPVLNARVIAEWEDVEGAMTGYPAWLASDTGTFMSHVIYLTDQVNKEKMLLGLIGHYVPEIWPDAAGAAIARIGTIAEYADYDQAVADIRARGATTPRQAAVDAELADADAARDQAIAQAAAGQHADAVWTAIDARSHLQEAYYLCQSSALPEFRSVWEHAGTGPYPGDWPAAIDTLVANGYSAVFPNMLKGGLAHYDSALLPHSSQFNTYGDQVTACVDAAHARGIEVHVWKVNWNLGRAPQSFIDQMRAEERTQVSAWGAPIDWLCPSHPDNHALERDSMLEVLQNYDIDGLHFDYIRYPGPDYCYCDGCRTRFEEETGNTVNVWPDDVRAGGPLESEFLPWRRAQITELVEAVYSSAKAQDPDVRISAAVYGDYGQAYGNVGQDWVDWIDRGIVDFLNPMSTTPDCDRFRELVSEQLAHADGRIPIYPGIGVSNDATRLTPDQTIAQVLITRELGTGGYIMFNYTQDLALVTLPALGKGTTLPGSVAETPDGDLVPGVSLSIAKSGGDTLELNWGESCDLAPGLTDYAIYRGTLPGDGVWSWDHQPVTCGTGGNNFDTVPMVPGDHYFLVVPTDTNREGGYGFDSSGAPRPAAATPCHPQSRVECP